MEPEIIYYDNHLVVINKPCGLVTHEDEIHRRSARTYVQDWVKDKWDKPGAVFLQPIYRLDRWVSGVLVFAKTSKAASRLMGDQKKYIHLKKYRARVEGILPEDEGILEDFLIHDEYRARVSTQTEKEAKKAFLSFKVLKHLAETSEIEVILHTGRYHQIRAQFSNYGFPILGDIKYGGRERKEAGIYLHAEEIEMVHPVRKKKELFKAKKPLFWSEECK